MTIQLAGCIILNQKGEVLLIHRNTPRLKQWELPGGKVEPGEELAAAAARETLEEIGVKTSGLKAIGSTEFDDNNKHWHYTWFKAGQVVDKPVLREETFDSIGYFNLLAPDLDGSMLSPNVLAITKALKSKQLQL